MYEPDLPVSPSREVSSSQIKQQSYASVVNKRPTLKKHDFEVSPSKVKTVEIEEGEVVEEVVQEKTESSVLVLESVKQVSIDSESGKLGSAEEPQNTVQEQVTDPETQAPMHDTEGWSSVSPRKSCKSNGKDSSPLKFGQVTILSASRFSVLNDTAEETDDQADVRTSVVGISEEEMGKTSEAEMSKNKDEILDNVSKQITVTEKTSSTRATLPRNSKNRQKSTSESLSQQAKMQCTLESKLPQTEWVIFFL
ncbi:predicted protein [Arabidopsis lyrata subsp. lyrata]|uniref:Predicted protein n=1 Tax=Arabidopsis lyrata subsp. lyrata TaxID=81972 RepID=D7KQ33_ARALL|nr:predicted protein [Arabidopsis lyrata subsp. lyrata]